MANFEIKHTSFTVNEGKNILINGVRGVNSFDKDFVSLELTSGGMTIEGNNMKIDDLSEERGEIKISGSVLGVYYSKQKTNKGLLSGIFG